MLWLRIVESEMQKKNNNDNNIYGNDDECINFINYVILIHLNGIFFQNKTFSHPIFRYKAIEKRRKTQSIFVSINFIMRHVQCSSIISWTMSSFKLIAFGCVV